MPRPRKNSAVNTAEISEGSAAAEPVTEKQMEMPIAEEKVTPINMVVEKKAPPVKILYIDSCIANNQIAIGNGRYITGSGRIFSVQMEQFEGEFMTPTVMKLLENRKFIVLSGLTDEQRQQYGCYYGENEVIRSEGTFDMLFTVPVNKAVEIYSALCPEHQQLVATRFATAFENHDNRITRDRVEALNKASKQHDPDGLFTPIVKAINETM